MEDLNKKSGYDQYFDAISAIIKPQIESIQEDKDIDKVIWNRLFDLDGPRQINSTPTIREKYVANIFKRFTEISYTYDQLRNIEIYLRRSPYTALGVSKVQYLRYNIENYFHSIYILKERLKAYLNFIDKSFKKNPNSNKIKNELTFLYSLISDSLKNVTNTRGKHVHAERFSDDDLDRIEIWELLSNDLENDLWNLKFVQDYKSIRKKWINLIEVNNLKTKEIMDLYCDKLYSIIFKNDGEIIIPKSIANPQIPNIKSQIKTK